MQKLFPDENTDNVDISSKKQMPGYWDTNNTGQSQSNKNFSKQDDNKTIVNEEGQSQVTNNADTKNDVQQKDEKEKSFYKNDFPDDDSGKDDEMEEHEHDIKDGFKDEDVNVEPVLDNDGNEIGGEG